MKAKAKFAAGFSQKTTHTTGEEKVETKTDTIEAQIEISEKSKIAVTITGKRFTAKVPWTGIQTKYYTDGSIATQKVTGTVFAMELFEYGSYYMDSINIL